MTNLFATGGMAFDSNGNMVPDLDNPGWQALGYKSTSGTEGDGVGADGWGDNLPAELGNLETGMSAVVDGVTYTRKDDGTGEDSFTSTKAITATGRFAEEGFSNSEVGDTIPHSSGRTYVRVGTGSGNKDFVEADHTFSATDAEKGFGNMIKDNDVVSFDGTTKDTLYGVAIPQGSYRVKSVTIPDWEGGGGSDASRTVLVYEDMSDPNKKYIAKKQYMTDGPRSQTHTWFNDQLRANGIQA